MSLSTVQQLNQSAANGRRGPGRPRTRPVIPRGRGHPPLEQEQASFHRRIKQGVKANTLALDNLGHRHTRELNHEGEVYKVDGLAVQ
jgi:hypothetical protein